jgi:hypothetical protein
MSIGMSGPVYPAAAGFSSLGGTPSGNIALDFVRSALNFSRVFDPRSSNMPRAKHSRISTNDFFRPKPRPKSTPEGSKILMDILNAKVNSYNMGMGVAHPGVSQMSYDRAVAKALAKARSKPQ